MTFQQRPSSTYKELTGSKRASNLGQGRVLVHRLLVDRGGGAGLSLERGWTAFSYGRSKDKRNAWPLSSVSPIAELYANKRIPLLSR